MRKIPPLYTVRQVSKIVGRTKSTIRKAINDGRLLGAHWVDGRWIIQEDFRIKHHGIDSAGFDYLPSDLISDEPEKDLDVEIPSHMPGNWGEKTNKVRLPGFARVTDGMTGMEIRRLTKVHNQTQTRILQGEKVGARVAVRIAKGLGIDVEELLVE